MIALSVSWDSSVAMKEIADRAQQKRRFPSRRRYRKRRISGVLHTVGWLQGILEDRWDSEFGGDVVMNV